MFTRAVKIFASKSTISVLTILCQYWLKAELLVISEINTPTESKGLKVPEGAIAYFICFGLNQLYQNYNFVT